MNDPAAGTTRQLPLALRYPPDQRLDTYVGAAPGVVAQLQALAEGRGGDWLYLCGPAGSGKTHLGLGACAAAETAGRRAAYLPLHSLTGRLPAALDALHACDLVALDGLDAIAGTRTDEVALFDFHNRARNAGIAVLYAAQVTPDALPPGLPDLRSRLAQCVRIALSPPDDDIRREVLRQRAQRRGLAFDTAAIDWLLRRAGRDLTGLAALLDRLDAAALAAQRRVTVPFLRQELGPEAR